MQAIYFLIPIALIVTLIAIAIFFWAVKSDQYNDLDSPAQRIILDDMHDYTNREQAATKSAQKNQQKRHPKNTSI